MATTHRLLAQAANDRNIRRMIELKTKGGTKYVQLYKFLKKMETDQETLRAKLWLLSDS
jgi:hypothetical protein